MQEGKGKKKKNQSGIMFLPPSCMYMSLPTRFDPPTAISSISFLSAWLYGTSLLEAASQYMARSFVFWVAGQNNSRCVP